MIFIFFHILSIIFIVCLKKFNLGINIYEITTSIIFVALLLTSIPLILNTLGLVLYYKLHKKKKWLYFFTFYTFLFTLIYYIQL